MAIFYVYIHILSYNIGSACRYTCRWTDSPQNWNMPLHISVGRHYLKNSLHMSKRGEYYGKYNGHRHNHSVHRIPNIARSLADAVLTASNKNPTHWQWRPNEFNGVSTHRRLHCLFNRLFRRRSMEISKLRVTGLGEGIPPVTGRFSSQRASNARNVSIWCVNMWWDLT